MRALYHIHLYISRYDVVFLGEFAAITYIGLFITLHGTKVLKMQKIADSDSFMSAPLHSSVSGTVTAIKSHPHPGGGESMCVFIKNDYEETINNLNNNIFIIIFFTYINILS